MPRAVTDEPALAPGASNPLIITPLTFSGGNVHGTEIEITALPAALRICQKVAARR